MNKKKNGLILILILTMIFPVKVIGGEKESIVTILDQSDVALIREKFDDKYDITNISWSGINTYQLIKEASMKGKQIDICKYWSTQMNALVKDDLAMNLDEIMDDEWRARFQNGALELGQVSGIQYNLPYCTVYPLVLVNKEIADQTGMELNASGTWTWEEFLEFCEKVKKKTGAYGAAISEGCISWLTRNANMQVWESKEQVDAFCRGEISFLSPEIIKASELVNSAFLSDCFYPGGEASMLMGLDEVRIAFAERKAACVFVVNNWVTSFLQDAGIEDYAIMEWPFMGKNENCPILGSCDGYFIPSTVGNEEGAREILDYLTSEEYATKRAESGMVSTIKIREDAVGINRELLALLSRSTSRIHQEISDIYTEIYTYIESFMPVNYYLYGRQALEELEELRLEAK